MISSVAQSIKTSHTEDGQMDAHGKKYFALPFRTENICIFSIYNKALSERQGSFCVCAQPMRDGVIL